MNTFSDASRDIFARCYPETPHRLAHHFRDHPLMQFDALAQLAESLPAASIEYNLADLPIGISGKPDPSGITIGDTIRNIDRSGSWAALKNVEQDTRYAALLAEMIGELTPSITARTGEILHTEAFIFITSPGGVTPYHFDPEHNILLQVSGSKVMTMFPAGDPAYAPDEVHETYHTGGPRELTWRDELAPGGTEWPLTAGEALYVPVMAPHFVRNGPEPSVSLSITWRSQWSYAESEARAFNSVLRKYGLKPARPGRWPAGNKAKAYGWRAMRRLGVVS